MDFGRKILVGVLLGLGAWATVRASSVYDDCAWFFNGGTDGFGGTAVDGVVQQGEIVDELHRGSSSHTNHWALPYGEGLVFVREKVPLHAMGIGTQEVSCISFPYTRTDVTNADDTVTTNFTYSALKLPFLADACTGTTYSAIFRVRRDAPNPFNTSSWFMSFGYMGGDDGWLLGWDTKGALSTYAANTVAKTGSLPSVTIPVGKWVDLGVVVTGNTIWFYQAFPGQNVGSSWSDYTPLNTSTLVMWKDSAKTTPKTFKMRSERIHLGGQYATAGTITYNPKGDPNTPKFAPITLQRVAFWNRALEPAEVAEAFAHPRPGLFTLGAANGSSDEFAASAATAKTIDATRIEDPYADVPAELRAGDTWTIDFDMKADDALNQLLVFTATPSSPAATLEVALNGTVVARSATLKAGGKCVVPIRAKFFKSGKSGTTLSNVLTIRRTDAGAPVGVDAVWLGGSWNVGFCNNSGFDFSWNGSSGDQFLNQFENAHQQRARNLSKSLSATNISIRIRAPKDVTDRYGSMSLIGRLDVDKVVDGHSYRLLENGQVLTTGVASTSWTEYVCPVGPGEHQLYLNLVAPVVGPVYWFDCYTLTFDIPPAGTWLILR